MAGKLGESGALSVFALLKKTLFDMFSLQVNVLSVFLLAGLLGPLMAKTAKLPIEGGAEVKPHLVVVTSNRKFHRVVLSVVQV
jgi:hypothetical protein